jgi:uncharacterized protein
MVHTSEVDFSGRLPIEGYGPGFFRVGGVVHHGPTALLPEGPHPWPGLHDMTLFTGGARNPDILLIGMGAGMAFVPPEARDALDRAGISFEPMATASACRSYNVLLAEGRLVAAALLPMEFQVGP